MKKITGFLFCLCFCLVLSAESLTLSFTGDILLSYKMEDYLQQYGIIYPFLETASILQKADIANGNLECPVSDYGTPVQNKSFYFKALPYTAESLQYAGFDILNIANNHIFDFGETAFRQTVTLLSNLDIQTVGAGENLQQAEQMKIIRKKSVNVGFLSFSYVSPDFFYTSGNSAGMVRPSSENVKSLIQKNVKKADILVVIFHWGKEYSSVLKPYQKHLAHLAVDAGADIVIGHHPHVLQPIEVYKHKIIAYSLGNFAFGTYGYPPKKTADKSMILNILIHNKKITQAEIVPVNVFNYDVLFQTKIAKGKKADSILKYISKLSSPYQAELILKKNRGYIRLP